MLVNGALLGSGDDGMASSIGLADALADEEHRRWFSFDDRKVL